MTTGHNYDLAGNPENVPFYFKQIEFCPDWDNLAHFQTR